MYKPRPSDADYNSRRRRIVFDYTLKSRLDELSRYPDSALILCCNDQHTADSLAHLRDEYPNLLIYAAFVNPEPYAPPYPDAETPFKCEWDDPAGWRQYQTTDRWARIKFALEIGSEIARNGNPTGYLVMPAHDAVWGEPLLDALATFSQQNAQNGLPAAVSPYTFFQHAPIPNLHIPRIYIDTINIGFFRHFDSFKSAGYQQFWGKMSLLPFGMCERLLKRVDMRVWEDDLEIDSALHKLGYSAKAGFFPNQYRQSLPVFNFEGIAGVFSRTLHYSLPIPGNTSILAQPFGKDWLTRPNYAIDYWYPIAAVEAIVRCCQREIDARLNRYGCSWVDWGAYRHVVSVGNPFVQVWKYDHNLL